MLIRRKCERPAETELLNKRSRWLPAIVEVHSLDVSPAQSQTRRRNWNVNTPLGSRSTQCCLCFHTSRPRGETRLMVIKPNYGERPFSDISSLCDVSLCPLYACRLWTYSQCSSGSFPRIKQKHLQDIHCTFSHILKVKFTQNWKVLMN